jgi:hypothetical protein
LFIVFLLFFCRGATASEKRRRPTRRNRVGDSGKIKKTRKIGKSGAFNGASALEIFNFAFILNFCEENKTARTATILTLLAVVASLGGRTSFPRRERRERNRRK